jgi:hypothetical protein
MKKHQSFILLTLVVSVVAFWALNRSFFARWFMGIRAEASTEATLIEMDLRMKYYEKREEKRVTGPGKWTEKDELEFRALEGLFGTR